MSFRCGLFYGVSPQTNAYTTIVTYNSDYKDDEEASPQYRAIMSAFHHFDLGGMRRLSAIDHFHSQQLSDNLKDTETTFLTPEYGAPVMTRSSTLSFSDSSVSSLPEGLKSEAQLLLENDEQFRLLQDNPAELLQSDGENGDDELSDGTDMGSFACVEETQRGLRDTPMSDVNEVQIEDPSAVPESHNDSEKGQENDVEDEDDDVEGDENDENDDDNDGSDMGDDDNGFDSDSSGGCSVYGDEMDEDLGLNEEYSFISFSRTVHFASTLETVIPTQTHDWEAESPTEPLTTMTLQEKIQIAIATKSTCLDGMAIPLDPDYEVGEYSRESIDLDKKLLNAYINGLRTISSHVCKVMLCSRTLPRNQRGMEGGVEPDTTIYVNEYLDRIARLLLGFFPNLFDEARFGSLLASALTAVSFDEEYQVIYQPGLKEVRELIKTALEETLDVDDMYMADDVTRWLASELIEPLGYRAMGLDMD